MQYVKIFNNLDALRRYLDAGEINAIFKAANKRASETGSEKFCSTGSWNEANEIMRDGDAKNAALMKAAGGIKAAAGDGVKTRRYSAVCGGAANVPAMLMGLPKSMIANKKITFKDSKVLNICYNTTVDCGVRAETIIKASSALAGAIMGMEKKGYRVNLYVCCSSESKYCRRVERCAMFVKIKDSGQYMDAKKLAYPLINPSFLRRHYFRFVETSPEIKNENWPFGYGHLIDEKKDLLELAAGAGLNIKDILCLDDIKDKTPAQIAASLAN